MTNAWSTALRCSTSRPSTLAALDAARRQKRGARGTGAGAAPGPAEGHGSNCAARNYMVSRNPNIFFETYNAFGI